MDEPFAIRTSCAQPYTAEELQDTPSRRAGIEPDKELQHRQLAAKLIQDMGQKLQVNQLSINTAIVYMHRFYMAFSFTQFHRHTIAPAALFLAAKVEEQPRKLEHVLKVLHFFLNHGPEYTSLDPSSDAYAERATQLVTNENILLQTLGFDVAIDHPHTYVVKCFQMIRGEISNAEMPQAAYFMATNSLHMTTMCLKYRPAVVACVCIDIICRWSGQEISGIEGKQWYEAVDPSVTKTMLNAVSKEFLAVLEKFPNKIKRFINSESLSQGQRQGNPIGPKASRPFDGSQRPAGSSKMSYPYNRHNNLMRTDYNRDKERRERDHRMRNSAPGANQSSSMPGANVHNIKHDASKMPPPPIGGLAKAVAYAKREHTPSQYGVSEKHQKHYDNRSKRSLMEAGLPPAKRVARERTDAPVKEMKKEPDSRKDVLTDPRRETHHREFKPVGSEVPKSFPKEDSKSGFNFHNNNFNILIPTEMPPEDIFDTENNDVDPFQTQTVHNKLKSPPKPSVVSQPIPKPAHETSEIKRASNSEAEPERSTHGNGVQQRPASHKKEQRSSHSKSRHSDSTTPPLTNRFDNKVPSGKIHPNPAAAQVAKNLLPALVSSTKGDALAPIKNRTEAVEKVPEPKPAPQIPISTSPVPKDKTSSHSSHHSKHKEKKKHKSKDKHRESSKEHKKSKKHKKDKHKEKSKHKSPAKDDEGPLKMTFVRSEEGTYTPDKAPPNPLPANTPSTSISPFAGTSLKIKIPKSRLPVENDLESVHRYSRDSLAPKVKLKIPKEKSDRESKKRERSPSYHKQVGEYVSPVVSSYPNRPTNVSYTKPPTLNKQPRPSHPPQSSQTPQLPIFPTPPPPVSVPRFPPPLISPNPHFGQPPTYASGMPLPTFNYGAGYNSSYCVPATAHAFSAPIFTQPPPAYSDTPVNPPLPNEPPPSKPPPPPE